MDKYSSFKKYPLIIPKKGEKLTARLLFTSASGQIIQYLEKEDLIEINNAINNSSLKEFIDYSKTNQFGICCAQFVSTSKTLDSRNVSYGDTILLLSPFQVCKTISIMIEKYCKMPLGMDKMFCHSDTGFCVCFDVSEDGKNSVEEIKSVKIDTSLTDDEFMQFLDTLELYKPERYKPERYE